MPLRLSAPATATGIGSVPGTEPRLAATRVSDQLPDLPHVPELPQRGPGSGMVGRTLGLLCRVSEDFAATTTPTGWELSAPGAEMRRAAALLSEDLDAVEEAWHGYAGPAKQQLAGPWTLAAVVERAGRALLADAGAVRDLVAAWAQMAAEHRAELDRRLPAQWILQMDEPSLPVVVRGAVPTASGLGAYPAAVVNGLSEIGADALHTCGSGVPYEILHGMGAVLIDFERHDPVDDAALATLAEGGTTIGFGLSAGAATVRSVLGFFDRTGLRPAPLLVTPPCGMIDDYRPWSQLASDMSDRLA